MEPLQHVLRVPDVHPDVTRREPLTEVGQVRRPEPRFVQERMTVHDGGEEQGGSAMTMASLSPVGTGPDVLRTIRW